MRNLFDVAWGREGFRPPPYILSSDQPVYQLPSTVYHSEYTNSNKQFTALYRCQNILSIYRKTIWLFPGININLDRPTVILSVTYVLYNSYTPYSCYLTLLGKSGRQWFPKSAKIRKKNWKYTPSPRRSNQIKTSLKN